MKRFTHIALLALTLMAAPVTAETSVPSDARSASSIRPYSGTFSYTALSPVRIETEGFALKTDSGSLKYDIDINVTKLPYKGGTAMRSSMVNISAHGDGIRLLPNGEHFSEASPALITLSYDPERLPVGYQPKDIYTYYCDDGRNWFRLERVSVDTAAHTITSYTTHFTDFANAVIKVPEMPESKAFVPTAMTDLPDADPMHGIPMIEVPTPNNKGTAELTYPIELPKGRRGLQPNVDLHYSSSGGNGILGVGWSLTTPAITIDTRWGAPRYSAVYETEQYLVNGAPVVRRDADGTALPLPYQDTVYLRRAGNVVRFYARDTKNADRIIRYGTDPTNYWWEVTDRNGITTFYGCSFNHTNPLSGSVDENSVVRTQDSCIAYWAATVTMDVYGNYIRYVNHKAENSIYVHQIDYTGNYKENVLPVYRVYLGYRERTDKSSSGRLGVLQKEDNLLCHLLVQYHHPNQAEPDYTNNLAAYYMQYDQPSQTNLFKSRLAEVVMLDSVYDLLLNEVCDIEEIIAGRVIRNRLSEELLAQAYEENDVMWAEQIRRDTSMPYGTSVPASTTQFQYQDAPSQNNMFGAATILPNANDRELSSSHSWSWGLGGTATVGVGPDVVTTWFSGGANYDFSRSTGECTSMLMDMNGDGLPDFVYEENDKVWYCKQYQQGDGYAFADAVALEGLKRLSHEVTDTHTWGLQISFGADLSYNNPISTSYTDTYFSDINGDGLPDMIDGEQILINHLTSDGTPFFGVFEGVEEHIIAVHNSRCRGIVLDGEVDEHLECGLREIHVESFSREEVFGNPSYTFDAEYVSDEQKPIPNTVYSDDVVVGDKTDWDSINHELDSITSHIPYIPTPEPPRRMKSQGTTAVLNDSLIYRIEGDSVRGYRLEYICNPVKVDPEIETVRVWSAPKKGVVVLTDSIMLLEEVSESRSMSINADGVAYSIQLCDSVMAHSDSMHLHAYDYNLLRQGTIAADDYNAHPWLDTIVVKKGDLLMFRLRSGKNSRFDKTRWHHIIRYVGETNIYDSEKDFICTGDNYFQAHNNGTIKLSLSGSNDGSIPVALKVQLADSLSSSYLLNTTLSHGTIAVLPIQHSVSSGQRIVISLERLPGFAEPRWSDIHLFPTLKYFSDFVVDTLGTTVQDTVTYYPDVHITHTSLYQESSPYRKLFGPMHKGWGAFAYQNIHNRDTIILDSLVNTRLAKAEDLSQNNSATQMYQTYQPDIPSWDQNDINKDSILSQVGDVLIENEVYNPVADSAYWVPMRSDSRTEQWIAYGDLGCIGKYVHSNAREIILQDTVQEIIEYDSYLPFRQGEVRVNNFIRKKSRSVQHSISLGALVVNESVSFGSYDAVVDYMDMNGDGYPDFVGKEGIQYSMPWGGIGELRTVKNFTPFKSTNTAAGVAFSACPVKIEKSVGNSIHDGKYHLNASMGASMGEGNSSTRIQFIDMNGDGLPDKVDVDSNIVRYNLGYSFSEAYPFTYNVSEGHNVNGGFNANLIGGIGGDISGNMGSNINSVPFAIGQVSISGGVGGSISTNSTDESLIDINGDGLPDKISQGYNCVVVRYNCGNQNFSTGVQLPGIGSVGRDNTSSITSTLGVTGGFTFLGTIKFNVGIQATPYAASSSRGEVMFTDMDGDGLVDYVYKEDVDRPVYVRYNKIEKTNHLVSVTNPTGQTIQLEYTLSDPSTSHRSRQWNMTRIINRAPHHPMMDAQADSIEIGYKNAYYDNYEKTDYGYEHVQTIENSEKVNKSVYHNQSLLQNGELKEDSLLDISGHLYIRRLHGNRYKSFTSNTEISEDTICEDANLYMSQDGYWTEYYEQESSPIIVTRYNIQYDQYHNVVEYMDEGDISTPDDDWRQEITYLPNTANNMVSLPKTESIFDVGNHLLRSSSVDYSEHGAPAHINFEDVVNNVTATTHLCYNALGNISKLIAPEDKFHDHYWTTFSYDDVTYSNVVDIDNPHNTITHTEYDYRWGLPTLIEDPIGNQMGFTYDNKGGLWKVRAPVEMRKGEVYTVKYTYNLLDHNLVLTPSFHYTHVYKDMYDSLFTQKEVSIYDERGRMLQKKHYAEVEGQDMWVVDGAEEWDAFGRVMAQEYPFEAQDYPYEYEPLNSLSAVVHTTYDIMDRPLSQTNADGTTRHFLYDFLSDQNGVTRFMTRTEDEISLRTTVLKSPQDRLIQQETADGSQTFFEYSPIGELLSTTDADGYKTSYTYDMLGRMTSRVHPDAGTTTLEYDLAGNLIRKQTANLKVNGVEIEYNYDFSRLKEIIYPNHWENNVYYDYDMVGRIAVRYDGAGSEAFVYDPLGNVAQSERRINVPTESYTYVFRTLYRYDSFGRMRDIVYPDGEHVHYGYTTGGLLKNVAGNKQGDEIIYLWNRLYDEQGRKKYQLYGNGVGTQYKYDTGRQWLEYMSTELSGGNALQDLSYKYDNVGNIIAVDQSASVVLGLGGQYANTYEYDAQYRLYKADGTGDFPFHSDYNYSPAGRMGSKNTSTYPWSTNLLFGYDGNRETHQPRAFYDFDSNQSCNLFWDANGNLAQIIGCQQNTRRLHEWDEENRLTLVYGDSYSGYYGYDGNGERVYKLTGTSIVNHHNFSLPTYQASFDDAVLYPNPYMVVTSKGYTKHYYAGTERIATVIGGGGFDDMVYPIGDENPGFFKRLEAYENSDDPFGHAKTLLDVDKIEDIGGTQRSELNLPHCGPNIISDLSILATHDMLLDILTNNVNINFRESEVYYYHGDHLGSANWITDVGGNPIQYIHYAPYGELIENQMSYLYDERYKFTGKERDTETGYDFFGARFLWGAIGHWLSVDPLADKYPNISPYAYCLWNPIKNIDPDGRSTHTNEDGLVVAVYDDNDLNIYKHSNAQLESWGDVYTNHLTAEGAEVMGKSLHAMSFADQSKYNNTGEVTHADGMTIDFGSTALGDAIKGVVDSKPSLLEYARNAQGSGEGGGPWNFKANSKYKDHGSQISDGVYLSPRDAGNVLAGAIKRQSGILAPLVQLGYGAYNITNNNKYKGAALSAATLYLIQVCPTLGLPAAAYVMNGEDKLTQLCIDWGYNHYGRK